MADIRTRQLWLLQECTGRIAAELVIFQVPTVGGPLAWQPRINLDRYRDRFVICAELAGVDRETIDLRIEPLRVVLAGLRPLPMPAVGPDALRQILTLEIDDGRWEREIPLPEPVAPRAMLAEQRNGGERSLRRRHGGEGLEAGAPLPKIRWWRWCTGWSASGFGG